jgi:hypothetical protein
MVRDLFAEASYKALTEPRKNEAGLDVNGAAGIFLRLTNTENGRAMLKESFENVPADVKPEDKLNKPVAPKTKDELFSEYFVQYSKLSQAGNEARRIAEEMFAVARAEPAKEEKRMNLVLIKNVIPGDQLVTTNVVNYISLCKRYYEENGYAVHIVDNADEAKVLLSRPENKNWNMNNTIVLASEADIKALADSKAKLLPLKMAREDQHIPIKGLLDLMATLVRVNRALGPEDQELLDAIRGLLAELRIKNAEDFMKALSVAGSFSDPSHFAKNFIIELLPPLKKAEPEEQKQRYEAARKVVESL